jgi:hypothetical protein
VITPGWIAWPVLKLVADATIPLSNTTWVSRRAWLVVPVLALAFAALTTAIRVRRVEFVAGAAGSPAGASAVRDRDSPWQPRLVIPGHRNESYEWLDLAREMFARRELRVRHISFENAPAGREVFASSPYRWWLGLVALTYRGIMHAPMGPSLEWAALYADPLLLLVFGALTTAFVAWRFGILPAALSSAALATLYPLAAGFLPGVPDDLGLAQALGLWSLLPLLAGASRAGGPDFQRTCRLWFALAGAIGGIGLWVNVSQEMPVLMGIGLGAIFAAWMTRTPTGPRSAAGQAALPWATWGAAGAATCLAAYLVEFFPSHMGSWEFRVVHPLFGVAWLGAGVLVARVTAWTAGEKPVWNIRGLAAWILSAAALASLPVAMRIFHTLGFLSIDMASMRLALAAGGPSAPDLWAWLLQNGFTGAVWATFLPLLILIPATLLLILRSTDRSDRVPIALALGPVLVAVGLSVRQINRWNGVDTALIGLVVATAYGMRTLPRRALIAGACGAFAALILLPGAVQLWPSADARIGEGLGESEVTGLVERDMAYWLSSHAGPAGAVALATPNQTATLYYYSGIRGLGTFSWEDRDGFQAAVRILSASTPEEAQELIGIHGVTHIIIPSWDPFMDAYAQVGAGQVGGTFLDRLHQWNLPHWLKPVPYLMPTIPGVEGQSAIVLEVVDEQDDATALSRIADYFVDMGQMALASKAGEGLRRFPADLGALVARAQVQFAEGDGDAFAKSVDVIVRRMAGGADRDLQWDQKVGLAIVLAQAHRVDLVRPRLEECLAEVDAEKLRSLSTTLLYRFQVLQKALNLNISDASLRALSFELLPPDLRGAVDSGVQK